ncbi:MAG: hypothetical protein ACP5RJ_09280, partial [Conexivisphaera sp.]
GGACPGEDPLRHARALDEMTGGRARARIVEHYMDPVFGETIAVEVDLSAREALELELRALDEGRIPRHSPIVYVEWTGPLDLSKEELVRLTAEIMRRRGLPPAVAPGVDAAEWIREKDPDRS